MVKRAKSPDTDEDEKYFTIYQPYPLNANWELPSDYIACSRWIAACIGTEAIHAIHYKPSARGMVIIEVEKQYPHNERLLGRHKWAEFLRRPTVEEKTRVTQIYHSFYKTGREAQKDGWKRIHVEAAWFKNWDPASDFVVDPYPVTEWCPVPPEDKTNKTLCRPLPQTVKPPPPKAPVPVVGSTGWVSSKAAPSQTTPQALKGAWAAKVGKSVPATVNASAAPPTNTRNPKSVSPTSAPAWNKPITLPSTTMSSHAGPSSPPKSPIPPVSAWGQPATKKNSVGSMGPPEHPAYPPGLNINIRVPSGQSLPAPPGLSKPSRSNETSSGSGASLQSSDCLAEKMSMVTMSPSQERNLYGVGDGDEDQSPEITSDFMMAPWEGSVEFVDYSQWTTHEGDNKMNLWEGEELSPLEKKSAAVAQCPYHAHTCKKGLCGWRAEQVKKEEAEIARQKAGQGKKGSGGGKAGTGHGSQKSGNGSSSWRQSQSGSSRSETNDDHTGDGFSKVTTKGRGRGGSSQTGSYRSSGRSAKS